MKTNAYLMFLALMVCDTLIQIAFKLAAQQALPLTLDLPWLQRLFLQPWIYLAFLACAGAFAAWLGLLRLLPLGPAFAAAHLDVVCVMFVSSWLFLEPLQWSRLTGALLIIAGIICLAEAETQLENADVPP